MDHAEQWGGHVSASSGYNFLILYKSLSTLRVSINIFEEG